MARKTRSSHSSTTERPPTKDMPSQNTRSKKLLNEKLNPQLSSSPDSTQPTDQQKAIEMGRQIPAINTEAAQPTFTCFSKLPAEIRIRIWTFALPGPRKLTTQWCNGPTSRDDLCPQYNWIDTSFFVPLFRTPVVMRVCQESRHEFLYELRKTSSHPLYKRHHMEERTERELKITEGTSSSREILFCDELDTLDAGNMILYSSSNSPITYWGHTGRPALPESMASTLRNLVLHQWKMGYPGFTLDAMSEVAGICLALEKLVVVNSMFPFIVVHPRENTKPKTKEDYVHGYDTNVQRSILNSTDTEIKFVRKEMDRVGREATEWAEIQIYNFLRAYRTIAKGKMPILVLCPPEFMAPEGIPPLSKKGMTIHSSLRRA